MQIYNYKLYVADEFFIVKMPCHNEYEKSPLMHKYVEILDIIQLQDCLETNGLYKVVQGRLKIWTEHSTLILLISIPFEVVQQKFQHFYNLGRYEFSPNLTGVA